MTDTRSDAALTAVLERAQQRGWIGSGPLERHIGHARVFASALPEPCAAGADLGSGGGLPGLVVALETPVTQWTLIDASARRVESLGRAVRELGLDARVEVVHARAEQLAHDERFRERFDAVVARSFGPPAVTAEVAAGLVASGGRVVVSDPPTASGDRWPREPLAELGLRRRLDVERAPFSLTVLEKAAPAPAAVPRVGAGLHRRPRW